MTNTYKLAKIWQSLFIIPAVCLILLFWSLVFSEDDLSEIPAGAWIFIGTVTLFAGSLIYNALTSKTITSPEGIENVSFGIRIKITWENVERIDVNQQGIINLIFKNPIYESGCANAFLRLLSYDKAFQLSPYIDDLATSNLLRDLAKYVPNSNIPDFVARQKHSTKTYQKPGMVGLYYFGWFIVWFLFAIGLQKRTEEYLTRLGLSNPALMLDFIGLSVVAGLFIHTVILLVRYNAEVAKLGENEVAHRARVFYLNPLVVLLIGLIVGIGLGFFMEEPSDLELPGMVLIGIVSFWVSSKIERFLFRDNS